MYLFNVLINVDLGTAPITISTFKPFLKIINVGILLIPYSDAMVGFESVLILTTFTTFSYSFAISLTIGAIILQGPHHGAPKSTKTTFLHFTTSESKLVSATCIIDKAYFSNSYSYYTNPSTKNKNKHFIRKYLYNFK